MGSTEVIQVQRLKSEIANPIVAGNRYGEGRALRVSEVMPSPPKWYIKISDI